MSKIADDKQNMKKMILSQLSLQKSSMQSEIDSSNIEDTVKTHHELRQHKFQLEEELGKLLFQFSQIRDENKVLQKQHQDLLTQIDSKRQEHNDTELRLHKMQDTYTLLKSQNRQMEGQIKQQMETLKRICGVNQMKQDQMMVLIQQKRMINAELLDAEITKSMAEEMFAKLDICDSKDYWAEVNKKLDIDYKNAIMQFEDNTTGIDKQ